MPRCLGDRSGEVPHPLVQVVGCCNAYECLRVFGCLSNRKYCEEIPHIMVLEPVCLGKQGRMTQKELQKFCEAMEKEIVGLKEAIAAMNKKFEDQQWMSENIQKTLEVVD